MVVRSINTITMSLSSCLLVLSLSNFKASSRGIPSQFCCDGECPCPPSNCLCTLEFNPVCGTNSITYGNECEAMCEGVEVECEGECPCPSNCLCTSEFNPVCGANGVNYGNQCEAMCEGVEVLCDGECPCNGNCLCTREFQPVCGDDGHEYPNMCVAACNGAKVQCKRSCPCEQNFEESAIRAPRLVNDGVDSLEMVQLDNGISDKFEPVTGSTCNCPSVRSPVCGINQRTYSNRCKAECEGVKVECEGECVCVPGYNILHQHH